jgi:hypothetical protein
MIRGLCAKIKACRGVAQLVARLVRDQEAVGSSPATPTTDYPKTRYFSGFLALNRHSSLDDPVPGSNHNIIYNNCNNIMCADRYVYCIPGKKKEHRIDRVLLQKLGTKHQLRGTV